jgi:hypothetical protein
MRSLPWQLLDPRCRAGRGSATTAVIIPSFFSRFNRSKSDTQGASALLDRDYASVGWGIPKRSGIKQPEPASGPTCGNSGTQLHRARLRMAASGQLFSATGTLLSEHPIHAGPPNT